MHAVLQGRLGENFVLLRHTRAWVNADISLMIMRLISEALDFFAGEWQLLLMLDAYRGAYNFTGLQCRRTKQNMGPHYPCQHDLVGTSA